MRIVVFQRNDKGQFVKGNHWREPKSYWDRDWLYNEYINNQKSAKQIADEQGCKEGNILYFLKKHGINTRSISDIRKMKYWGLAGEDNPMYGKVGKLNHNWKGGCTPERQSVYVSIEWKKVVPKIWRRDNATCQLCNKHKNDGDEFHIHHITPFADELLRMELDNLVLLCKSCHQWIHSKKNKGKVLIK